jgi:Xaa-Pro aminopeptidase
VLLNVERARELLRREGLDGLIAGQAINQYYLTDHWGVFNTPVGYDGTYFGVFPRDAGAPAALVLPALEIRRLVSPGSTWVPLIHAYSAPGEEAFEDGTPRGTDYGGWPLLPGVELSPRERGWVSITERLGRKMSPDAFGALGRSVRSAGLSQARVAVDDARIAGWLAGAGVSAITCEYRPQLFNEIRLVKTEAELALMRVAARCNENALLHAADQLRVGSTWDEIEDRYMARMAEQGARGVYLMCGIGELPAERARAGEPIMFDALGQHRRYHGDFGRCTVLGEPGAEHRARHRALCIGWEAAQEWLRPGVRYSELARAVGDAVRQSGLRAFRDPIVHSLGLEHTDDPKPHGVQPQVKPDQVLQVDMVVNVDMPHTEIGWGSVHMEDTVRIVADGCEFLTSNDTSLRIIPLKESR